MSGNEEAVEALAAKSTAIGDVIVTVAHPWGDIEAPLPTWIEIGPGPRPLVTISKARRRDGSPVLLEEIPAAVPQHRRESTTAAARPAADAVGPAIG